MALAGWLVWRESSASFCFVIFLLQLALNAALTLPAFDRRSLGLAVVEIASLWLAILATTVDHQAGAVHAGNPCAVRLPRQVDHRVEGGGRPPLALSLIHI